MSFCKNCGNELKDTDKFCKACGTKTEAPIEINIQNSVPKTVVKVKPRKRWVKIVAVVVVVCVAIGLCSRLFKSDEDKILDRLDAFATAYNEGDSEKLLKCFDSRSRNQLGGLLGIGSSLLGVEFSDIFGLSVGYTDAQIKIEVIDIEFVSDEKAEVELRLIYSDKVVSSEKSNDTTEKMTLVKEKNDWFIVD